MDLKESDILASDISRHWYYRSKAKAMSAMLGSFPATTILDVGAGSGYFSRHLLTTSSVAEAWCVDTGYTEATDDLVDGKPIHFRRSISDTDADLVLLMDVLEHVDDDLSLLKEYGQMSAQGTRFLISVPAFQFLWSEHDDFLEHKRRYTLRELEGVARRAGLGVIRGSYFFGFVFPIAASMRIAARLRATDGRPLRSHLRRHHPLVNQLLSTICQLELPLVRINRMVGLTAFCLAHKQ